MSVRLPALAALKLFLMPAPDRVRSSRPRVAFEPLEGRALMCASAWPDTVAGLMAPRATAVSADRSVIVVGSRSVGPVTEVAVARLTPHGELDATFGSGGLATARWHGMYDSASEVVVTPDGKIVVAGFAQTVMGPPPGDMSTFGVARFNADGTLDTTFGGGDGLVTINVSAGLEAGADSAHALALDADGRIIVAGTLNYRLSASPSNWRAALPLPA